MISKEIKFLLTHSSIYGLGTVVSRVIAFVLLPLYTRYLTPADYGILETIDITTAMIGLVVTIGISQALSRFYYISDNPIERNSVVSTTYITYAFISLLCLPFLIYGADPVAKLLFTHEKYGYFLKISFITLVLGGLVDLAMMYLRLKKKPLIFISLTTVRLILLIIFNVVFIVYYEMGVIGILYSSLIVRALYAVVLTSTILCKVKLSFSINRSIEILRYGLPMIPSTLANTAVKQSDKYFVLYIMSVSDMGIYSLALKLGNAIHSLLTIPFNMAYIPRRFEIMKRADAQETYKKIFTYYMFFTMYAGLFLSVFIHEILQIMVTEEFRSAGTIIPLVVLSMIIFGCHYHFDFGILYSKKTSCLAYINMVSAVLNLGLNYSLIQAYGLYGAVWSAIIILSLQALLLYYFSEKFYHINYEFFRIFKFMIVACVIYFISWYMPIDKNLLRIAIKILLVTVIFFGIIIHLKIITPAELNKLEDVFRKRIKAFKQRNVTINTGT